MSIRKRHSSQSKAQAALEAVKERKTASEIASIDWFSRAVLSWNLSNSMETVLCTAPLEEALGKYPHPNIFNSDQGVQYTSELHTGILKENDIRISMDGRG